MSKSSAFVLTQIRELDQQLGKAGSRFQGLKQDSGFRIRDSGRGRTGFGIQK
jgi:hypothetical protein